MSFALKNLILSRFIHTRIGWLNKLAFGEWLGGGHYKLLICRPSGAVPIKNLN